MGNQNKLVITNPFSDYENVYIFHLVQDIEGVGFGEAIAEAGRVYIDNRYVLFGKEFWRKPSHYLFDYLKGIEETKEDSDRKLRKMLHYFATEYVKHVNQKYESSLKEIKALEEWCNVTLEDLTLNLEGEKTEKVRLL